MTTQGKWYIGLKSRVAEYVQTLQVPGQVGRFFPCRVNLTPQGKAISLGFSCFAHKIYYTLGLWEALPTADQAAWNEFIKSFQVEGNPRNDAVSHNAFVDLPLIAYLERKRNWVKRLLRRIRDDQTPTYPQLVISSETKQAIATLAQVSERPTHIYRGFPTTPQAVTDYLAAMDWSIPWGAGAHTATLTVFFSTQATEFMSAEAAEALVNAASRFVESVLDQETGAYFLGNVPNHGLLVNGAMKVLTALDWLDVPVHYPENLIDTTLYQMPPSDGCHLVDAVYVLYRCAQQTGHRKQDVQQYCRNVLAMIKEHFIPAEGGFSFRVGYTQHGYYQTPIIYGKPAAADIHGTILLCWALAMIFELLEQNPDEWRVIKP